MKDKKTVGIIAAAVGAVIFLLIAVLLLDFVVPKGGGHTHEFKELASFDAEKHIFECRCGKTEESAHEYGTGEVGMEPTCKDGGVKKYTCAVCKNVKLENTDKTDIHNYSDGQCRVCGDITITDEKYFVFTLLDDGTYSVSHNEKEKNRCPRNVRIPETYNGKPVTAIAESGFEKNTRIESMYIPDTVKEIGYSAFYECTNMLYIRISENVRSVPGFAFGGCRDLMETVLPDMLESIEAYAFSNCLFLKNINVPSNLDFIGYGAFANCRRLKSFDMSNTKLTVIEGKAFYACTELTNISLPASLEFIGESAFENCKMLKSKIVLPDTLTYLGKDAFSACAKITEVVLPAGIVVLEENVFRNCSMLVIPVLPETLAEIKHGVFYGCAQMPEYLPLSLKTIGKYAFRGVQTAGEVKYDGTTADFMSIELSDDTFSGTDTVIVCTDGEIEVGDFNIS